MTAGLAQFHGMRHALALTAPLFAGLLAYAIGLTQLLGAHPWWADRVLALGLVGGLGVGAALGLVGLARPIGVIAALVATGGAFAVATVGKARFAASYAEDALAGQMWFFGWIAVCGFAAALIVLVLWPRRGAA